MKIVNRFLVHRMSSRSVQGQGRRRSSAGRTVPCPSEYRAALPPASDQPTNQKALLQNVCFFFFNFYFKSPGGSIPSSENHRSRVSAGRLQQPSKNLELIACQHIQKANEKTLEFSTNEILKPLPLPRRSKEHPRLPRLAFLTSLFPLFVPFFIPFPNLRYSPFPRHAASSQLLLHARPLTLTVSSSPRGQVEARHTERELCRVRPQDAPPRKSLLLKALELPSDTGQPLPMASGGCLRGPGPAMACKASA